MTSFADWQSYLGVAGSPGGRPETEGDRPPPQRHWSPPERLDYGDVAQHLRTEQIPRNPEVARSTCPGLQAVVGHSAERRLRASGCFRVNDLTGTVRLAAM